MGRNETPGIEKTGTRAPRETITWAAAIGFLAGGLARLTLGGTGGPQSGLLSAVCLPLGPSPQRCSQGSS